LSIILLPFIVIVVVPYWLVSNYGAGPITSLWLHVAGELVFATGFVLSAWCLRLFVQVGRGTLAPWDPTRKLVATGPYQVVRNPMVTGVALMLAGEALFLHSLAITYWLLAFIIINHGYFVFSEEPGLEKRFGESYRQYKLKVPRWLPRLPLGSRS